MWLERTYFTQHLQTTANGTRTNKRRKSVETTLGYSWHFTHRIRLKSAASLSSSAHTLQNRHQECWHTWDQTLCLPKSISSAAIHGYMHGVNPPFRGFLTWGTPKSSISEWDFPWNKPTISGIPWYAHSCPACIRLLLPWEPSQGTHHMPLDPHCSGQDIDEGSGSSGWSELFDPRETNVRARADVYFFWNDLWWFMFSWFGPVTDSPVGVSFWHCVPFEKSVEQS